MPGRRMHYAVPAIAQRSGLLGTFYTDFYLKPAQRKVLQFGSRLASSPVLVAAASSRWCSDIATDKVRDFKGLALEYLWRRRSAKSENQTVKVHLWFSEQFTRLASQHVSPLNVNFTFNSTTLEVAREATRRGGMTVMEQCIAPRRFEMAAFEAAQDRYPVYYEKSRLPEVWREYAERELEEARHADWIIAPSNFVAEQLVKGGIATEKVAVIPYGVAEDCCTLDREVDERRGSVDALRLLFVGQFGARKGAGLVLEIARHFGYRLEIRVAGDVAISEELLKSCPENVILLGRLNRTELCAQYRRADALLLPSLCEGSPTVSYEAFMHELPVICTHESGVLMQVGKHGEAFDFLDLDGAIERIESIMAEPATLISFRVAIREDRFQWSLARYQEDLLAFLSQHADMRRRG